MENRPSQQPLECPTNPPWTKYYYIQRDTRRRLRIQNTLESHFLTSWQLVKANVFGRTTMDGESSLLGNGNNGLGQNQHHSSDRSRSRGSNIFLITCRIFGVITALAALFCIAINVIAAVQSFRHLSDIFDGIFRCYAVVIAIIVVIAETEWDYVLRFSKFLQYWVGRGLLQIFVAVMTKAYPGRLRNTQILFLLQSMASYFLLACGVIYVIAGIFGLGMLKRSRQKGHVSRDQAIKDLENLQRHREELEAILKEDQA